MEITKLTDRVIKILFWNIKDQNFGDFGSFINLSLHYSVQESQRVSKPIFITKL